MSILIVYLSETLAFDCKVNLLLENLRPIVAESRELFCMFAT